MNNDTNIQEMVACATASYDENARVNLTSGEVEASEANKKKRHLTVRQLQVVRGACNLSFLIAQIETKCPRHCRCLVDELERLTSELIRLLDLSNENKQMRWDICTEAHGVVITLEVKIEILYRLKVISKDTNQKCQALCKSVKSQIIGWRNSKLNEGSI